MTLLLVFGLATGCGAPPEPPRDPGTGSREAAAAFFDAIARQEWAEAFDALDDASRKKTTAAAFAERAKSYRKNLRFDLAKVHVRLCEEQGVTANAHVVLSDQNESRKTAYRDAIALRKSEKGWGVVLPANFGAKR